MTEKNLDKKGPKAPSRSLKAVLTKTELEHQYKLGLMRDCQIYGKSLKECKIYFAGKGYSLSKTQFTGLRNELKSQKSAKNWFSREALYVIEEDHMISVETGRAMVTDLVNEYWSATELDDKLSIVARWESLQVTLTKMFSATPMVQELMEVHRRQEQEEAKALEATPHA
jgi:hypothetical protein